LAVFSGLTASTVPHTLRKIPFRAMNRPLGVASVIDNCATWRCVCRNPIALQGRSGPMGGPTPDTVVVCDRCGRVYFVIPQDRSHGVPVEVVELFGFPMPEPGPNEPGAGEPAPTVPEPQGTPTDVR
jgi:hypothetical protein